MSLLSRPLRDGRHVEGRPRGQQWRRWGALTSGALLPLVLLGVWYLVVAARVYSTAQLPPPGDVLRALAHLAAQGGLGRNVAISVQRVLLGFLAGSGLGLVIGGVVGLVAPVRSLLAPTIAAVRAVPSLAWVPLLLLWLGIGEYPKITLVAIGAFFPVYTTMSDALRHVDPHLVEVGRAYGRSGTRLLVTVLLPAVAPAAVSALRLGLAQSWLFLVAAELIASSMGLGFLLIDAQNTGRTDVMLLVIILLAVLGKLTDALLGLLERRLLPVMLG